MVKRRTSALTVINKFIQAAGKKIDIKKVVLFGSHATGRFHTWSDIDIAVISDDFEGMNKKDRLIMLSKIAWEQKITEVDALGYTEAEFATESPLDLVAEIKEHGIVVYEKP